MSNNLKYIVLGKAKISLNLFIKCFSVLFVAITFVNCSKHSVPPKRIGFDSELYGDVEQLTIKEHRLLTKFGEVRIDSTLSMTVITFNPNGNVSKVEEYETATIVIEEGRWKGTPWQKERLISVCKYTYGDNLLTKTEQYDEYGDLSQSILYSYDESDKLIEKVQYSSDSDIEYQIQYHYSDDLLTKTEASFYDTIYSLNFGKLEKSQRESYMETEYNYKYDKRNKLIHKDEVQYYKYDIQDERCDTTMLSYDYDANGNVILESKFDESFVYPCEIYKHYFNKNSKLTESTMLNDQGEIEVKQTFHYDKKNRLIEKLVYNPQNDLEYKWICENDSHGNIIKSTKYEGVLQIPTTLITVDIVYRK